MLTTSEIVHEQTTSSKPVILVVDDDEQLRTLTVALLTRAGYRTIVAKDGDEALRIINCTVDIDLVLTDVVMPGKLNGFALAQRALEIRPSLKVLCLSGYTRGAELRGDCPPVPLLQKPIHPAKLRSAVAATLQLVA